MRIWTELKPIDGSLIWIGVAGTVKQTHFSAKGMHQCSRHASVQQACISAAGMSQCSRHASVQQACVSAAGMRQCSRHASVLQACISAAGMHQCNRHASVHQACVSATAMQQTGSQGPWIGAAVNVQLGLQLQENHAITSLSLRDAHRKLELSTPRILLTLPP